MLVLLTAVLASLAGFVTLGIALLLANRREGDWQTWLSSFPGGGVLCLGAAGCLLAGGGQYKLVRILQAPAEQAERLSRLQLALQEPLEQLLIRVQGVDPFEDRRVAVSLRLRLRLKSGQELVSEVPRERLKVHESEGEDSFYTIAWQAVVDGATTSEGRALAGRFLEVSAFQRVEQFAVELVQRGPRAGPLPDSLFLGANDRVLPPLFRSETGGLLPVRQMSQANDRERLHDLGAALCGAPLGQALVLVLRQRHAENAIWIATCDDDHSPAARIARFWPWELSPPQDEFGLVFALTGGGGAILIALGVGMLTQHGANRV